MKRHAVAISVLNTQPVVHVNMQYRMGPRGSLDVMVKKKSLDLARIEL
jgi:hypothetical protein